MYLNYTRIKNIGRGLAMASKTTHARIDKKLLLRKKNLFPDYTPNDVFKVGLTTLVGIKKTGEFIYGKNTWKKINKK